MYNYMSHLPIIVLPPSMRFSKDISLRQACRAIDVTDADDIILAQSAIGEMFKTLYSDPSGVALAAPQVGIQLRITVISYDDRDSDQYRLLALVNPEIIESSEEQEDDREICLSIPNFDGKVTRAKKIKVKAFDQHGKPNDFEAEGFFATVIQHEVDHLNGILYIDRLKGELQVIPDYPERRLEPTLKKLGIKKKKK